MFDLRPYSLSPCWFVPQLQPSDPSVVGIIDRIEAVDVGLDVEKRCLVEHIDPAHRERATRAFDKFYYRKADSIRTTRVPGRKDSMRFVIEECRSNELDGTRAIEGVNEEDVREELSLSPAENSSKTSTMPSASPA
jgi:hypothetical protein